MQRQKAVTAHLKCEQVMPFGFARSIVVDIYNPGLMQTCLFANTFQLM